MSLPLRSLGVAAGISLLAAAPGAFDLLALEWAAVDRGEIWRLVTGHLVHASPVHLLWNVLPLIALGVLFEARLGRAFWSLTAAGALTVGVGEWLLDPALGAYCGVSGVLNTIWVGGALIAARDAAAEGDRTMALLYRLCIAGDLAKIAFEAATGQTLFTDPGRLGGAAVPLAHALGALAGAAWFTSPLCPGRAKWRQKVVFSG